MFGTSCWFMFLLGRMRKLRKRLFLPWSSRSRWSRCKPRQQGSEAMGFTPRFLASNRLVDFNYWRFVVEVFMILPCFTHHLMIFMTWFYHPLPDNVRLGQLKSPPWVLSLSSASGCAECTLDATCESGWYQISSADLRSFWCTKRPEPVGLIRKNCWLREWRVLHQNIHCP